MGYFSSAWFVHRSGQVTDEIAINPTFCAIRPSMTRCRPLSMKWYMHGSTISAGLVAAAATIGSQYLFQNTL
jgi:hypothetical protein